MSTGVVTDPLAEPGAKEAPESLVRVAAAARTAAAARRARHGARAGLAGEVGGRNAQKLRQVDAAARLTGWRFVAPNEEFLLFLAVAADEFVERHGGWSPDWDDGT
jgi:hypothetical protein